MSGQDNDFTSTMVTVCSYYGNLLYFYNITMVTVCSYHGNLLYFYSITMVIVYAL